MRIAVLPFCTAEGVSPAIGRQLAAYWSDTLRGTTGAEISSLNLTAPLQDQPGRTALVNLGDALLETEQMLPIFDQVQVDLIMDGLLKREGEGYHLTVRFTNRDPAAEQRKEELTFDNTTLFKSVFKVLEMLAEEGGLQLPEGLNVSNAFGTQIPEAFLSFLEGHDAFYYVRLTNGMVAQEFDPAPALGLMLKSVELDTDFDNAFVSVMELCRMCAQYRIGKFVILEDALKKLTTLAPDDYRPWYMLADIHMSIGEAAEASIYYERAIEVEPNEPAIYTRLGISQLNQGMPANAERNFRKALEKEGDDKPSLDMLASVLAQTGRMHEIPALWKERIDALPNEPTFHAKYGFALMQSGREDEGEKAFDHALEVLEDSTAVKRYYAPILVQKGEYDRAMDFYEDCLDVMPTDVPLMMEYARTLDKAGRDFEVPPVLRNVLSTNPEPNVRAEALGWLIELEQPKRAEAVQAASDKAQNGDFEGAVRDLKPLKNWLGEYWKMWAVLAQCYNQLGDYAEAEDAAGRLVNLMPGYEPAYGELMHALSGQNEHEKAYNAMKWAAMNMPQSLPIHLNFGLAAKHAGHEDEARNLAKQIREALGAPNDQVEPVLREMEA